MKLMSLPVAALGVAGAVMSPGLQVDNPCEIFCGTSFDHAKATLKDAVANGRFAAVVVSALERGRDEQVAAPQ